MSSLYGGIRLIDAPSPDNISRMDMGALPMISDMHRYGIRLDVPFLNRMSKDLRESQAVIQSAISREIGNYQDFNNRKLVPFSVGSAQHVGRLLFDHLRIQKSESVARTPSGQQYTTDDDVLTRFRKRHPVVQMILDWRELDKFAGTYTEPLAQLVDADGFLHSRFNVTTVATGRLSVGYVQTIPARSKLGKQIRNAFIAAPGCLLVSADLSQIEMRWAAHLSQDTAMCDVFRNNGDIHIRTACSIFERDYPTVLELYQAFDGPNREYLTKDEVDWCKRFKQEERLPSKTAGFGTLYETGPMGLQGTILNAIVEVSPDRDPEDILREWPESRCGEVIDGFYQAFPSIRARQDLQHRRAMQYAMVWDAFGRVRLVPEAKSSLKKIKGEGFRKAGNHEIQASAQGSLKVAMARLTPIVRELNQSFTCFPSLQVHDQLIFNVQKAYAEEFGDILKYEMESAVPLDVPVLASADTGERWGDL
jgi:DNA polymerase I